MDNVSRLRAMLPPSHQDKVSFDVKEIVALGIAPNWTVYQAIREGKLEAQWITKNTRRVPIDSLADWFFAQRPEADGTERYRDMHRKRRRPAAAQ